MTFTSAVISNSQVDTDDAALECSDTVTEDSVGAASQHRMLHRLMTRKASHESSVKDTDRGKTGTTQSRLKRKKSTDHMEGQQTSTDMRDDLSEAAKSHSWTTSKKLILTPPAKVRNVVDELSESSEASGVDQHATRAGRLTRKVASVNCDDKHHVETVTGVSEKAAQQLAAEPRVIVHNIKSEPDCSWRSRARMSSLSASDEASDGEVIVKETIVIASDDPPPRKHHLIFKNLRTLKDYEANARQLLKDYDGTQSVDVEELFDECNMSEVIDQQDIIEIDDDDEWSQMPAQVAAVRYTMHCFVLHIVKLTLM